MVMEQGNPRLAQTRSKANTASRARQIYSLKNQMSKASHRSNHDVSGTPMESNHSMVSNSYRIGYDVARHTEDYKHSCFSCCKPHKSKRFETEDRRLKEMKEIRAKLHINIKKGNKKK